MKYPQKPVQKGFDPKAAQRIADFWKNPVYRDLAKQGLGPTGFDRLGHPIWPHGYHGPASQLYPRIHGGPAPTPGTQWFHHHQTKTWHIVHAPPPGPVPPAPKVYWGTPGAPSVAPLRPDVAAPKGSWEVYRHYLDKRLVPSWEEARKFMAVWQWEDLARKVGQAGAIEAAQAAKISMIAGAAMRVAGAAGTLYEIHSVLSEFNWYLHMNQLGYDPMGATITLGILRDTSMQGEADWEGVAQYLETLDERAVEKMEAMANTWEARTYETFKEAINTTERTESGLLQDLQNIELQRDTAFQFIAEEFRAGDPFGVMVAAPFAAMDAVIWGAEKFIQGIAEATNIFGDLAEVFQLQQFDIPDFYDYYQERTEGPAPSPTPEPKPEPEPDYGDYGGYAGGTIDVDTPTFHYGGYVDREYVKKWTTQDTPQLDEKMEWISARRMMWRGQFDSKHYTEAHRLMGLMNVNY